MKIENIVCAAAILLFPLTVKANPEEVGKVVWGRDYDAALAKAKSSGKPLFVLFQEVPGCAGCKQFGREVLGDDKVVRGIEENFTPLLIHNNKPGKDADVLKRFNEPSWNFQVVRFLDAGGKDLIPRKDKVWDAPELEKRMALALEKAALAGPKNPRAGNSGDELKRVAIAQHCFWAGEMALGGIDGVQRTEAGFMDGAEVTMVDYDPAKISLAELSEKAKAAGVATKIHPAITTSYRKAPQSDQKRQLQGTRFAALDLTPEQAAKVNAFARSSPQRAEEFLTEEQRRTLR